MHAQPLPPFALHQRNTLQKRALEWTKECLAIDVIPKTPGFDILNEMRAVVQAGHLEAEALRVMHGIKCRAAAAHSAQSHEDGLPVQNKVADMMVDHDPPRQCPAFAVAIDTQYRILRSHMRVIIRTAPIRF